MSKKKALPKPKAVPVSQLKEHKKNPRVIDDFKLKALRKSLQEFGDMMEVRPVLYDEDNIVLAGNMRLRAARELGWATIMGIQVKGLSRSEKEELLIKDNVNYGVWDDAILDNHFDVESLEAWTGEVRVDYSFLDAFTDLDEDLEEKASSVEIGRAHV